MADRLGEEEIAYVRSGVVSDLDTLLAFNLLRTHSYLGPFVDADLRQRNLTAAQLNVLLVLRAAGAVGLLMSEIGHKLVVTRANVTGLVDRLERQRLVARADHTDRRATIVRLTDAGRAVLEQVEPGHAKVLSELTGCLSGPEKQVLIQLLTKLRRELRARRKGEP